MSIRVHEESWAILPELARVPIAFEVDCVLDVDVSHRGFELTERQLAVPYVKNYDTAAGGPLGWPDRFDVSNWGLLIARTDDGCVGGATVAWHTPQLELLEDCRDLALLWDLRISPVYRRRGAGGALFRAAADWALARGCRQLIIETQNINVPACRFYAKQGCILHAVNDSAYVELPDEVQLIWRKELKTAR